MRWKCRKRPSAHASLNDRADGAGLERQGGMHACREVQCALGSRSPRVVPLYRPRAPDLVSSAPR